MAPVRQQPIRFGNTSGYVLGPTDTVATTHATVYYQSSNATDYNLAPPRRPPTIKAKCAAQRAGFAGYLRDRFTQTGMVAVYTAGPQHPEWKTDRWRSRALRGASGSRQVA